MIEQWQFLYGTWISDPDTQLGDPPEHINRATIKPRPSKKYIHFENRSFDADDKEQSQNISILYFENRRDKFKMQAYYQWGFVVHYMEETQSDGELVLVSDRIDDVPEGWEDRDFRYHLIKDSKDRFTIDLEIREDTEYKTFWKATYNRQ